MAPANTPKVRDYLFDKVFFVGTGGSIATLSLAEINTFVAILAGAATFCYVSLKIFFLLRNKGK